MDDLDPQALLDTATREPHALWASHNVARLAAALIEAREDCKQEVALSDRLYREMADASAERDVARAEAARYRKALEAIDARYVTGECKRIAAAALSTEDPDG